MSAEAGALLLVGRILMGIFWVVNGVVHLRGGQGMQGYARSAGFPLPYLASWPTGVWLSAAALSVALGVWPDVGVLMIAVFVTVAASYFHTYWRLEDQAQQQVQQLLFWRNVIILGASLALFGAFAALGPALRFAITAPLFQF